jgi:RHS repeat-associated protein
LITLSLVGSFAPLAFADAPKGAARRWEAALPVGKYGQVNLRTGRLLTTIPITGWSGRGPSIQFNLYHNQNSDWGPPGLIKGDLNDDGRITPDDIDAFIELLLEPEPSPEQLALADFNQDEQITVEDLAWFLEEIENPPTAPDWRHSYSSKLIVESGGDIVRLIRDDGSEDTFTNPQTVGGVVTYDSPPGVWDRLTVDNSNDPDPALRDGFMLTTKHHGKAHYNRVSYMPSGEYRLDWLSDAARYPSNVAYGGWVNKVKCHYDDTSPSSDSYGKLTVVEDATWVNGTGRKVQLAYNANRQVREIKTPLTSTLYRVWKLLYATSNPTQPSQDGTGDLQAIEDPRADPTMRIWFSYNDDFDLDAITDKNGRKYTLEYSSHRLDTIIDPAPALGEPLTQRIIYFDLSQDYNNWVTDYFDRRGKRWEFTFNWSSENLETVEDPLLSTQTQIYAGAVDESLIHDVAESWNALAKHWDYEYFVDAQGKTVGNIKSVTDPLGHKTQYEYDSLNNLTQVTPPADDQGNGNANKAIRMKYEDPFNPTSATEIAEAGTATSPEAVTLLDYWNYDSDTTFRRYGRLKTVTPPFQNAPVLTTFEYDNYGQLNKTTEGGTPGATQDASGVTNSSSSNAAGQQTGSGNGVTCSETEYDGDGNVISNECNALPCFAFSTEAEAPAAIVDGRPQACAAPPQFSISSWLKAGCFLSLLPNRGMGQPRHQRWCVNDPTLTVPQDEARDVLYAYDELDRLRTLTQRSAEVTGSLEDMIERVFQYNPDWAAGTMTTIGPDGHVELTTTDDAGRVETFARKDSQNNTIMSANFHYDAAGRLTGVNYETGANTQYEYDDANRVSRILHQVYHSIVQDLQYAWTPDGLVDYIIETDEANSASLIDFTYDNRNRLTEERRTGTNLYWFVYTYDKAGNRLSKLQKSPSGQVVLTTVYHYDVENPSLYQSQGNHLMSSHASGPGLPNVDMWYEYDKRGRVFLVMRKASNLPTFVFATRFAYDVRELLWMSLSEQWQVDSAGNVVPNSCQRMAAMEYRYDNGRRRYMVRPRDPSTLLPPSTSAGTWFDFDDNDGIWGDYTANATGNITGHQSHVPALAQFEIATSVSSYVHTSAIGTNELMTALAGALARRAVFTAFGEPVYVAQPPSAVETRYGYAGAWGYQEQSGGDPLAGLGWLHVGARYYDPASGRFLQRDPIGISGGPNTYVYCDNNPVVFVDPKGNELFGAIIGGIVGGVVGAITGAVTGGVNGALSGLVGGIVGGALTGTGLVPPSAAGAIGGAVSGAVNSFISAHSGPRTVVNVVVGGVTGGVGGGVGGAASRALGGGRGAQIGIGVGSGLAKGAARVGQKGAEAAYEGGSRMINDRNARLPAY